MLYRFFIDRPIFANVIAIVTMIVGGICLFSLPVEQYPKLTPPTVQVTANYPGANAAVLADTVAGPLEQAVNGVENMIYMSSMCSDNGAYTLTITFEVGADLDQSQVLVQNRIATALPRLPQEVQRLGVTAQKQTTNMVIVIGLTSKKKEHDGLFLSNLAEIQVKDILSRVPGVGNTQIFGSSSYGMRIWLDPEKLKAREMTTNDVVAAISAQNVQVAAGQIGQRPAKSDQSNQFTVSTQGRFSNPEQFGNIIVKSVSDPSGAARLTRVKDVARIELGAQTYASWMEITGKPAAGVAVFQLPGANSISVAQAVEKQMEEVKHTLPEGVVYNIAFNPTEFVEESIHEVYKTLFEAGVLVLIVILVFLQDWRAVLIPATTVPVTIIGAFGAMSAMGYSINMLTLFGLVLAIGIVVDDAIVIVENAVHHIDHSKQSPRSATIKAMGEVIGPVIGITLVLMAVFVPTIFMAGITGKLYQQFALTIAATAVISAINAVTLKPAQCAVYLRPTPTKKNFFYRGFNRVYAWVENIYVWMVRGFVRHSALTMVLFVIIAGGTGYWFTRLPTSFVPPEDQGYAILAARLDDAASLERTEEVIAKLNDILSKTPGVSAWFTIGGMSLLDNATVPNAVTMFLTFEPRQERLKDPAKSMEAILGNLYGQLAQLPEAIAFAFPPPAIEGLGQTGGFEFRLQDRANQGLEQLQQVADSLVSDGNAQSSLNSLQTSFRASIPQLYVDIDREKATSLGIPLQTIFSTLQASLGSAYVNDFNKFGRTWQVQVQADQRFRRRPEDIKRLEVRTDAGEMVPIGTFATVKVSTGPQMIPRYNLYPSVTINGNASPGVSSGQAMALMEQMASEKLPPGMGYEWSSMSYQEKKVSGQAFYVFGMAVLMVYLVLAAQYENWFLPAAVILVVPLALLGTVAAVAIRGMDNNIYTQIGIVLIIALASKNAILIVEFARDLHEQGRSIRDAAIEAARMRFRPILMTSFAFILGIFPLVIANGAGAASRRSLGTAVFGGMIAATFLAIFFVPVFYTVMQILSERVRGKARPTGDKASPAEGQQSSNGDHEYRPDKSLPLQEALH
ncbi:Efflux pump membrane transporter BepE [Caulifigura coniformis]|uniref:Efflux pump membrane transporter BepE n=1 Tax=Caulifigura coniformis TaxID=2527983 RepID=A0A517SLS1_9PLAN|nr:multidrug efflux RND transporter permease subunit [Caulifigura coniformis]QDT57077.1 Efflux pump membrane transporter BepE [Caulifigura coniformis]